MNTNSIQELNNIIDRSIKEKSKYYLIKKKYQIITGCIFIGLSFILIIALIVATSNIAIQQALIAIVGILIISAITTFNSINNLKEDKEINSLYPTLGNIIVIYGDYYGTNEYSNNEVTNYTYSQKQNSVEVAEEIQKLLKQLSKTHPTQTTQEKITIAAELVDEIENSPNLKQRILSATKAGGISALKNSLPHPAAAIVIAAIEGWQAEDNQTIANETLTKK